jgi:hypothetical protein
MEARAGEGVGGGILHRGDSHARAREWDRIAAIAGLVFIALIIASFFTPETPSPGASADEIARAVNADRTGHQWSLLLGFLSDIAFFVLFAGLWSRLRRYEGPAGMLSGLFALGGAAFISLILVSEGIYLALVQAADSADPSSLPAISALDNSVGGAILPAGAAMFLGVAAAIVSTRALPAWLGWLAALTSVLLVVSLTGVFSTDDDEGAIGIIGFASFLLILVWFLAASVTLLMRAGREPEMAA